MADVTGPISTLPGSRHESPKAAMCDSHPHRPAVARIQGETDAFGSEMVDACQECATEMREARNAASAGRCDWCGSNATDLRPRRDYEEGMSGRVYDVCGACVRRENEQVHEELEALGYYDDNYD